jgi:hypothetical protein
MAQGRYGVTVPLNQDAELPPWLEQCPVPRLLETLVWGLKRLLYQLDRGAPALPSSGRFWLKKSPGLAGAVQKADLQEGE